MGQPIEQKMGPEATKPQFTCITELSGSRQWLRSLLMKWSFLNLLAEQQTKMHNIIYQNHLALDYLLATGGGMGASVGSSILVTVVYR